MSLCNNFCTFLFSKPDEEADDEDEEQTVISKKKETGKLIK